MRIFAKVYVYPEPTYCTKNGQKGVESKMCIYEPLNVIRNMGIDNWNPRVNFSSMTKNVYNQIPTAIVLAEKN